MPSRFEKPWRASSARCWSMPFSVGGFLAQHRDFRADRPQSACAFAAGEWAPATAAALFERLVVLPCDSRRGRGGDHGHD